MADPNLRHSQFAFSLTPRPGHGLMVQGKTRIRGGAKVQQQKRKLQQETEKLEQTKHTRTMMEKMASLAEKALDKI